MIKLLMELLTMTLFISGVVLVSLCLGFGLIAILNVLNHYMTPDMVIEKTFTSIR